MQRMVGRVSPLISGSLKVGKALLLTSPGLSAFILIVVVIGVALSTAFMFATGSLVSSVTAAAKGAHGVGPGLMTSLAAVGAIFVVRQVLAPFQEAAAEKLGRILDGKLRARVMNASLEPPGIAHMEEPDLLDEISLVDGVGPGRWTPGDAARGLADNIATRLQVLVSIAILSTFQPLLGLAILVSGWLLRSRVVSEGGKRLKVLLGETQDMRRTDYFRDMALTPHAAKEIRTFGLGDWILERFRSQWLAVMTKLWQDRRSAARPVLPLMILLGLATAISFLLAANAAVNREISIGFLVILMQATMSSANWTVTNNDLFIEYGAAGIDPVGRLEERAAVLSALQGETSAEGTPVAGIEFKHVSFGYPGRNEQVFKDLDLFIPAGRSLAIVGPNGAGKTTLVKLLARLHDPSAGTIRVDGKDLRGFDPDSWRNRLAVIFQDFVKFALSVSDNVGFGGLDLVSDRGALERAARRVGALKLIEELPHGWDTVLSREFPNGADLSGGQWQKIALARAMFAIEAGASLLILDEPTASLDVRAEVELFDQFLELTRGLTTILISHRFSSVRRADRICVLEGGRIVEEGTHQDLMHLEGRYAWMFNLQASRFSDPPTEEEPSTDGTPP